MKFLALIFVATLALTTSAQAAIYRYTSDPLRMVSSSAISNPLCEIALRYTCYTGPSPDARVTFEFSYEGPLPVTGPGNRLELYTPTSPPVMPTFEGFEFSSWYGVEISTNAAGDITEWYVDAYRYLNSSGVDRQELTSGGLTHYFEFEYECGGHFGCVSYDRYTAAFTGPGTWEVIGAVPLPASGLFLLAGIGGLALRRRVRRAA
ncbi:MAG: VPLPA-CTERM sorting domain-containing protein [Pseudomonadota bacterium]|nr:VPLPA-CTERM sorting domain-containing protein [Pseudomonadota bacterium]